MKLFDRAWRAAKERGAQHLEIISVQSKECEITAFNQEIRSVNKSISNGVGIRVITDHKVGFTFTTNLNNIEIAARKAAEGAVESTSDENNVLPPPQIIESIDIYRESLQKTDIKEKKNLLLDAEKSCLESDNRISPADANYNENDVDVFIKNSHGLDGFYKASHCAIFLRIVAEQKGDSQSSYDFSYGRELSELGDVQILGARAADKAISLLGGKKISSRKAVIILDPIVASQTVSLLASAVSAEAIQKNKSFLAGKLEKKVSSEIFNLIDDGLMEKGYGSTPFDDEGVARKKTTIIKDGVLHSFLHNSYTARKEDIESTGNASRKSFKSTPGIGPTNIYVKPSKLSHDELINSVDEAFYVTDISGLHSGANPITGEFSVGATGYWMTNGKIKHAVREVTISSSLIQILNSIQKIADDLKFFPFMGNCGSPTLLIKEMVISGS